MMPNLSITTAWNEASAFVRREAHLLFPIAFLLGSLPGAAAQLLAPRQQLAPGQMPEAGAWMLLMPLGILCGFIASLAISYLALRPGISVGDALGRGLRRLLPMIGAMLIVGIGAGILLMVAAAVAMVLMPSAMQNLGSGQPPGPESLAAVSLILLLVALPVIFFGTRLSLVAPAAAVEDGGPLAILRRSWRLTSGHFWKILGFLLLFGLAYIVIALAVQFVLGSAVMLVAGRPDPGSVAFIVLVLVEAVISAIFSMFLTATLARIYAQLTGDKVAEVFA